jgi:hydrogenase large subunit
MKRITIDPITRIEGHLRVDVEVEGGSVSNAWVSGQMWRGLEVILRGRDPRDAWVFAQRICGVCTTVHAIASIRAVEHALNVDVPVNAQHIRNIMIAQHSVQDHIVHFYHLCALDWVDVLSALKADPKRTAQLAEAISDWPGNGEKQFKAVKDRFGNFASNGRLGIFSSGYWGHPAMKLPPEVNLLMVSHYLQALDYQRKGAQAVAILGGKNPHIQNLCVGGVATAMNVDNMATLNTERLEYLRTLMGETRDFVHKVYYPDVLLLASAYREWFRYGSGVRNYLAVPEFPQDSKSTTYDLSGGICLEGNVTAVRPIVNHRDPFLIQKVTESVAHSWYEGLSSHHPWQGETKPQYTHFSEDGKYSWCKAPRLDARAFEVGPTAQVLAAYAAGKAEVRRATDIALSKAGVTLGDLGSTMGRILARCIRAYVMADLSLVYLDRLTDNLAKGDTGYANPAEIADGEFKGVGFHEAPRGTLSHWIVIRDKKIANYQAVVPSTWNASPRDDKGVAGPYEASLVGNPVAQPEKPLEVLRTLHSFDPCIACAVHMFDPSGTELVKVKVL